MITHYRVIDETDNSIVAMGMITYEQAYETLTLYSMDHPEGKFTIESYSVYTVKPGFGRDPDLH